LNRLGRGFVDLVTYAIAILWAVPIVWVIGVSFRAASNPLQPGSVWIALPLTIQNYLRAWSLAPNFSTIRRLHLFDPRLAIAIPYFGSAFGTFLMRQAFLEVPHDLVDAGIIDGASWWQLLWYIFLPPSIPTLVAFTISSLSFHWNDFLWPLIVTNSDTARPLTAGLVRFTQLGEIGAQWSLLTAATITVIAPLLLLFLVFQRSFIESFLHTGLK